MKKEVRTVVYDDELRIEAYRFEGIARPFPNHFHEYYWRTGSAFCPARIRNITSEKQSRKKMQKVVKQCQ